MEIGVVIGALATAAVLLWALWEPLMKIFQSTWEAIEARRKAAKAKAEAARAKTELEEAEIRLRKTKHEEAVEEKVNEIKELEEREQRRLGSDYPFITGVTPLPGEDPEIVKEAWRRFKERRAIQRKQEGKLTPPSW